MRLLFLLLLLANIAFAALIQLGAGTGNNAQIAQQQIHPEKIRLVPPRRAAAPAEKVASKLAAGMGACVEWGAFAGNEMTRAVAALAKLELGDKLSQRSIEELPGFWVYIPPLKSRQDADKKISELKTLGVTDYFLVQDNSKWRNAISLGIFKTEEAANNRLQSLKDKGVRSAVMGEWTQKVNQVMFVVREPGDTVQVKLVELQREFPGSELKATQCASAPVQATAAATN